MRWGIAAVLWCVAASAIAGQAAATKTKLSDDLRDLRIDFAEPMQALANDKLESAVRITPAIPGASCHWSNDTAIACTFKKAVKLATAYRIDLEPALRRTAAGASLPPTPLRFESARPLARIEIRNWEGGVPSIVVQAQATTRASLARVLRVDIDGRAIPVELREDTKNGLRDASTIDLPETKPDAIVTVSIVPGLASKEGPLRGLQDQPLLRAQLREPFRVRGAVCAGANAPIGAGVKDGRLALEGCVPGEPVRLFLSREVDKASMRTRLPEGVRLQDTGTSSRSSAISSPSTCGAGRIRS